MTLKDLKEDKQASFYNEPYVYGLDYYDDILVLGVYNSIDDKIIVKKNNKITLCKVYYTPTDRAYFKSRTKTYYLDDFLPKKLG